MQPHESFYLGRIMGLEPTASGATIQRSNQTELYPPRTLIRNLFYQISQTFNRSFFTLVAVRQDGFDL